MADMFEPQIVFYYQSYTPYMQFRHLPSLHVAYFPKLTKAFASRTFSMDPKLQRIIALMQSKQKSNFAWKRQEVYHQLYYAGPNDVGGDWASKRPSPPQRDIVPINRFTLLSWNIDFMLPFAQERMTAALSHLESHVATSDSPVVVFLQEMLVEDLALIRSLPWIQKSYNMTDYDDQYWESGHYGTCTLIPKSLHIASVFRVHYDATKMERDALYVDVEVGNGRLMRLCNSHLESLVADPPLRPRQVEAAAKYMHESGVHASVMAGDFNAIQPFDRTLHSENGLLDAYLATGGKEDVEDAYTWGQMAPTKQRQMFGCSRMDKIFFCGGFQVESFERFGLGVAVAEEEVKKTLVDEEGLEDGWVTDHLGVKAVFKVVDVQSNDIGGSTSKI